MKLFRALVLLVSLASIAMASDTYWIAETPFKTYGEFNPAPVRSFTFSGHTVNQLLPGQPLAFASNSGSIVIGAFVSSQAARTYSLYQDGNLVGDTVLPTTPDSTVVNVTLGSGLDTSVNHEYEIIPTSPVQVSSGNWYDAYLILDTNSLASIAHPNRPVCACYGDSITALTNASPPITDIRLSDMYVFCHANHMAMAIAGTAGGKVVNTGRDSTSAIPANVDLVRVLYGTNDLVDITSNLSSSGDTTFQTAYGVMIDNIIAQIGSGKKIVCEQPLPRSIGTERGDCGTLIRAAIAGKANTYYVGTDFWWDPNNGTLTADGLHPNQFGYVFIANREIPVFATHAFTISGPASGRIGTTSSAFTVNMYGGATFTGDQTVVLTGSAGTISATAVGGTVTNNGTSAVTIVPANGATAFTAIYSPSSIGNSTITPTAAQDQWAMPAPTGYACVPSVNLSAVNVSAATLVLP